MSVKSPRNGSSRRTRHGVDQRAPAFLILFYAAVVSQSVLMHSHTAAPKRACIWCMRQKSNSLRLQLHARSLQPSQGPLPLGGCRHTTAVRATQHLPKCVQTAFAWHRVWWVPTPHPIDAPATVFSEGRAMRQTSALADDIGDRAVRRNYTVPFATVSTSEL